MRAGMHQSTPHGVWQTNGRASRSECTVAYKYMVINPYVPLNKIRIENHALLYTIAVLITVRPAHVYSTILAVWSYNL